MDSWYFVDQQDHCGGELDRSTLLAAGLPRRTEVGRSHASELDRSPAGERERYHPLAAGDVVVPEHL